MSKQILLCTAKNEVYQALSLSTAEPVIILNEPTGMTVWSKFDEDCDEVHYLQVHFREVTHV